MPIPPLTRLLGTSHLCLWLGLGVATSLAAGCEEDAPTAPSADLPSVHASVETPPVATAEDAADDPAIWVHPTDPNKSLVLGTNKKAGLHVYSLDGLQVQFLPAGDLNNVDLRQGVSLDGEKTLDLVGATNRPTNSVDLFLMSEAGAVPYSSFASQASPYGFCMGRVGDAVLAIVTYKTGLVEAYQVDSHGDGKLVADHTFDSQLEGCVHDDEAETLFVGEEATGIWKMSTQGLGFGAATLVDGTDGPSGITADVEGLALYSADQGAGYLIASSQGNNSYAVYERQAPHAFLGRFAVVDGPEIDGSEETDGIDASALVKSDAFPEGLFVAQDGFNKPDGENQNFKLVDWRNIKAALSLD